MEYKTPSCRPLEACHHKLEIKFLQIAFKDSEFSRLTEHKAARAYAGSRVYFAVKWPHQACGDWSVVERALQIKINPVNWQSRECVLFPKLERWCATSCELCCDLDLYYVWPRLGIEQQGKLVELKLVKGDFKMWVMNCGCMKSFEERRLPDLDVGEKGSRKQVSHINRIGSNNNFMVIGWHNFRPEDFASKMVELSPSPAPEVREIKFGEHLTISMLLKAGDSRAERVRNTLDSIRIYDEKGALRAREDCFKVVQADTEIVCGRLKCEVRWRVFAEQPNAKWLLKCDNRTIAELYVEEWPG